MPKSLTEFASARKGAKNRKRCAICRLPNDIQKQIVAARERRIRRPDILAWLVEERKLKLTMDDLVLHMHGRHA